MKSNVFAFITQFDETTAAQAILNQMEEDHPAVLQLAKEIRRFFTCMDPQHPDFFYSRPPLTLGPLTLTRQHLRTFCAARGQYPAHLFPERPAPVAALPDRAIDGDEEEEEDIPSRTKGTLRRYLYALFLLHYPDVEKHPEKAGTAFLDAVYNSLGVDFYRETLIRELQTAADSWEYSPQVMAARRKSS